MRVESLGLATDLALIATRGSVVDRGAYLVTATPDDPGYYHGNMLVLPAPLEPGELSWALALFAREVGADPAIRHVTLCWDGVHGEVGATAELTAAGFSIDTTLVMSATEVAAAPPPPGIELRPLAPDELARATELAFAIGGAPGAAYRQFLQRRTAWHRDLVVRQAATFWGAFADRTLVASLGVVRLGRLGRYQDVQTAPGHRRQGIAAALLAAAGAEALSAGVEQLAIHTLAGSEALRVYERIGFRTLERTASACREPPPPTVSEEASRSRS
ncbi:MAG TPA: GNAT family N-acetyltransferase [Kofleriaceae bacterium]|nr:GNAT family N-acetyltransferase [Kofleriaceae bacterium]